MQLDIPEGRALVYAIVGAKARLIYRDRQGNLRSEVVVFPDHLRPHLHSLVSLRLTHEGRRSILEVPVRTPAHTVHFEWAGGIETMLHGGDRPDHVRVERVPFTA